MLRDAQPPSSYFQCYSHIHRHLQTIFGVEADDLVLPKSYRDIPWVRVRFAASIGCARLLRQRPYNIRCTCRPFRSHSNPKRAVQHSLLSNSLPQMSRHVSGRAVKAHRWRLCWHFLVYQDLVLRHEKARVYRESKYSQIIDV
jgi:hypothetical protein